MLVLLFWRLAVHLRVERAFLYVQISTAGFIVLTALLALAGFEGVEGLFLILGFYIGAWGVTPAVLLLALFLEATSRASIHKKRTKAASSPESPPSEPSGTTG